MVSKKVRQQESNWTKALGSTVAGIEITPLLQDSRMPKPSWAGTKGVLVIYSGGTIGSVPKNKNDPNSPLIPAEWEVLRTATIGLDEVAFKLDAISFRHPVDSSNIGPNHWKAFAMIIEKAYDYYDGFVILHGTDTMAYTASALSFILNGLGKPVVLTGSQISAITQIRNDGQQNLITAALIAQGSRIPEVCIFFRDKLLRGNRTRKVDASGFIGFDSPNYPALGVAGDKIDIDQKVVRKRPHNKFSIQTKLDTNVIYFDVFPGLQENIELLKDILAVKNLHGVVLKTFGAGNVPTEPASLIDTIRKAADKGIVIINVTQCTKGRVEQGLYDTSAPLSKIGVIDGEDITAETALTKLSYLLGKHGGDIETIKHEMQKDLAGEITPIRTSAAEE